MITVHSESCIGCGVCQRLCCMGYLQVADGKAAPKERRRCISCGHCVSACPKNAIELTFDNETEAICPTPENDIEALILSRRSVRHFRRDLPPREVVQRAIDLAEYTPSGKNRHEHHWVVLYGLDQTQKLTDMALDFSARTGEAKELLKIKAAGTNLLTCDAPCVIINWSPDNALNPIADPALAMAMVEAQLNRAGLATCWGGYLRQISEADADLRAHLGIPDGCNLRCALMVGYADRETYLRIPPRPRAGINWIE